MSPRFEVDNTPPRIEALSAKVEGNQIRVTLRAVDSFSPIGHAEYSIDAGDWQLVDPVGQISDSKTESYDFDVPMPSASGEADSTKAGGKARCCRTRLPGEHTIVVRVYDRFENMGISKVVVNVPGQKRS